MRNDLSEARKAAAAAAKEKHDEELAAKLRAERETAAAAGKEKKRLAAEAAERNRIEEIQRKEREAEAQRARARAANLKCVDHWKQLYEHHQINNVDAFQRTFISPRYSSTSLVEGNAPTFSDASTWRERSITYLKSNSSMVRFSIIEATDTYVRFTYTNRFDGKWDWTVVGRFDFESPGVILRGDFVSSLEQ